MWVSAASANRNLISLGLTQVPSQFSSDSLWSYEIGSKNTFLDHRLQINASLFYIDWSNIQQNVYLPACGEQFTANLGKAKSEGGDIEILYKPVDALTFDLTAAYTDARLTKTSCAGTLAYDRRRPAPGGRLPSARSPPRAMRCWAHPGPSLRQRNITLPNGPGARRMCALDFQHSTAQKSLLPGQDSNNALFDTTTPGLPVLNNLSARAGLRFNGVDISAYANNLTNAHPLMFQSRDIAPYSLGPGTGGATGPTTDTLYFGRGVRPRTIGITCNVPLLIGERLPIIM